MLFPVLTLIILKTRHTLIGLHEATYNTFTVQRYFTAFLDAIFGFSSRFGLFSVRSSFQGGVSVVLNMENYEKIKSIGRGAYGTVYLCRRKCDGRHVIIKDIPVEQMSGEERRAALNEVHVLQMLKHPNIIAYFDSFFGETSFMIAMEYAQGGTLHNLIEEREGKLLDEEEIIRLFVQILVAIYHVHKQKILHRDLKTQNILLNKTRKVVKIGDFGISKVLSSKSKAHSVIGTPCYISPELCEGKPYNQKSDIWALGCVLYELATLKRAFEASNLPALVLKIMKGNFNPISERYSEDMKNLVLSMLQVDPAKRPTLPQIMAQPLVVNALFNMGTDIGRVPCNRTPRPVAGISGSATIIVLYMCFLRYYKMTGSVKCCFLIDYLNGPDGPNLLAPGSRFILQEQVLFGPYTVIISLLTKRVQSRWLAYWPHSIYVTFF